MTTTNLLRGLRTNVRPLFTQHPVLAPQPVELFALRRRQPVAAQTFIESGLLDPFRIALAEASNSRANCAIGRPERANSMMRRRYSGAYGGWVLGIGDLLLPFSQTPSTKPGQLQAAAYNLIRIAKLSPAPA